MKKQVYLILFLLLNAHFVFSQKTYVWDKYKIQITVPRDLRVQKNTDSEFEMKGVGLELSMNIFEENVPIDDLDDATIAGAKEIKLQEIDHAKKIKINELEGYFVEGFKDGNRIVFAGMGNPNSHTNFFIAIIFDDDDKEAEKDAIDILNSLDVID